MEINAIKLKQNEHNIYVFVAEVKFIHDNFNVSIREHNKEKGYQRNFSQRRFNSLKSYLVKGGYLPNSILVNINPETCHFDETENKLVFDKSDTYGFIIDGQHRVGGTYIANEKFPLIIVATIGLSVEEQAKTFITINRNQKGVPTSLYLDLFDLIEGTIDDFDDENVNWKRRATEIARRLNEDEDSPLYGLIRMQGQSGEGISLAQFVSNVREHVKHKGNFYSYTFEEQYNIFKIFFRAVKAVFLEQWNNNKTLILKSTGFGGLLYSVYEIFNLVRIEQKIYSTDNTIKLLSSISDFKFDDKTLGSGSSQAAQKKVSEIFVNSIKDSIKENSDSDEFIIGE